MTRTTTTALALAVLVVAVVAALGAARGGAGRVVGDESTYLAMTESLVVDRDLRFGADDADRLGRAGGGRGRVILQRTPGGVAYSKPAAYPLVAAPFFALLGEAGLTLCNALFLLLALALVWRLLCRTWEADRALLALVSFAGCSVLPVYVGWAMSDALQASLALGGTALALGGLRPGTRRGPLFDSLASVPAGGALLGLLAALRTPNALLALTAVLALAVAGRRRKALVLGLAAASTLGLALAANQLLGGTANPYGAERATFAAAGGYPLAGGEEVHAIFAEHPATHHLDWRSRLDAPGSAYSTLYFLVGRHTGVLLYFPAAVLLVALGWRRAAAYQRILFAGAATLAVFYLLWLPENYFGGAAFVGNRYWLPAYPLLLVAAPRLPGRRGLAALWLAALVIAASAAVSVGRTRGIDTSSQNHVHAGVFRWLPLESTAASLDGCEDRYWADEFVRFADPWAGVARDGFTLSSAAPPAELLIANPRPAGILRFAILADAPGATLVYGDWKGRQEVALEPRRGGSGGVVEIVASPAWRRHRFRWGGGDLWRARGLRLALAAAGEGPVTAELRYLGPYRLSRKFFSYAVLAAGAPAVVAAGEAATLPITLRNTGLRYWESRGAVPIVLGYRLVAVDGGRTLSGAPTRIAGPVERGQNVTLGLALEWPRRPGRYRLSADLSLAGVEWFETWTGAPILRREVEVVPP